MQYYKVVVPDKLFRFNGYMQTVQSELFTPGEFRQYSKPDRYGLCLKPEWLEAIDVKKTNTYWFFGARFASKNA